MKQAKIINTLNTTRICKGDYVQNAIHVSDIVYAGESPDSIIIANGELYQDAFAATSLVHFPRNAPILFSYMNFIPQNTLDQIYRLEPRGVDGIQVFIVGGISYDVEQQIESLGFRIKRITGRSFYETAAKVAEYLNFPQNIMIVSSENYEEGLSACAMAAHMGVPILFTDRYRLPIYTRSIIQRTQNPSVYIIGGPNSISIDVERELQSLNVKSLDRVSGSNPYDIAVNFAKYTSPKGDFGWGRTEKEGHAFTFTSVSSPFDSVSGSLFAHLGKHTPILVVNNRIPEVTYNYIESVKPLPATEPHPPFMHGWVMGCEDVIAAKTQLEIERALSIDEAHMNM